MWYQDLMEVCGVIGIFAGGNFTQANFRRFPELLDFMLNNGLTPERLHSMQFYPVVDESADFGLRDFLNYNPT